MLVISFSVAAAGILVCAAGLLDILVPTASIWWFMLRMVALAAAIILIVSEYVWACDKCEDYLSGRIDRLLSMKRQDPTNATSKKEAGVFSETDDSTAAAEFSQREIQHFGGDVALQDLTATLTEPCALGMMVQPGTNLPNSIRYEERLTWI
jgi:hypothetical protein